MSERFIVFRVSDHEYVFEADRVKELLRPGDITPVEGAPDYLLGVMTVRGRVLPVVEVRARLGLAPGGGGAGSAVIAAELPGGTVGFVVDSAAEIVSIPADAFAPAPPVLAGPRRDFVCGIARPHGRLLIRLDLERLADLAPGVLEGHTAPEGRYAAEAGFELRAGTRTLVAFELGGELYGLPVTLVAEISHPLPLAPLPHVPPHVVGLANLRGVVLPVIDLRSRFGLPHVPDGDNCRLVVLKGGGKPYALRVDSVLGMTRLPESGFRPAPPGVAHRAPEFYDQVTLLDGRLLVQLSDLSGQLASGSDQQGTASAG